MFSPNKPWKNIKKGIHWQGIHLPVQEMRVWSLGWEDPLEKEMATHSSVLVWEIPWTEEPGGLQYMGSWELGTTECLNSNNNAFTDTLPGYGLSFMSLNLFICCGVSHRKIPHTGWLETAGTYFLTNLETQVQDQSVGGFGFSKPLSLVCRLLSSHRVQPLCSSLASLGTRPVLTHITCITSLKAPSPNTVSFWGVLEWLGFPH